MNINLRLNTAAGRLNEQNLTSPLCALLLCFKYFISSSIMLFLHLAEGGLKESQFKIILVYHTLAAWCSSAWNKHVQYNQKGLNSECVEHLRSHDPAVGDHPGGVDQQVQRALRVLQDAWKTSWRRLKETDRVQAALKNNRYSPSSLLELYKLFFLRCCLQMFE